MWQAIKDVHRGLLFKTAARNFDVPVMSLKICRKGPNKLAVNAVKKVSKTQVLTKEQDEELVTHILDMESRKHCLTSNDLKSIVAVKNGIFHPFSKETCFAGKDWLTSFQRLALVLLTDLWCPNVSRC